MLEFLDGVNSGKFVQSKDIKYNISRETRFADLPSNSPLQKNQSYFLSLYMKKMIGHWLDAISFITRSIITVTASCGGIGPDNLVLG